MATVDVYDLDKVKVGTIDVSDEIFNAEVKEYLIHEALKIQLANRRAGTASVKNRAAVAGGGKKPYRQKGTGQARQGSVSAPHYPGGGVAFGPQPKTYKLSMNKKARKVAISSLLSMFCKDERLTVVKDFAIPAISTKSFANVLKKFDLSKALLVTSGANLNLELSARNIKNVKVLKSDHINIFDMMKYQNILITQDAVRNVEGALAI
ncbi:MAG: 50S ribosomal protein L4 [Desulfuromonadales bacterium]|nr:50S ribosomal protein L4 [Desulfuromonadales bacterium]